MCVQNELTIARTTMPKRDPTPVHWLDDAADSDYAAAAQYLALLESPKAIEKALAELRAASVVPYKAVDLLRAAQLLVPKNDERPTREQIKKIKQGEAISPVLLLRVPALKKVIVADGFHRICAAYRLDPDVEVRCKLAG
jgi:hypothetical protein